MAIVWISKTELAALSTELRRAINGEAVEFRDNQEGALSVLKNDLHTLVTQLSAERDAADAARTEFAEYMENITHQLKTPVTSMMLMADLLEAAPPERQEEFLANIRTSLARMNWLVDTLLKLAKLDAGENPLYEWLSVRDAGSGLSREEMAQLFVRFAGSHKARGVGIGLPLALAIARGQNGDIDVDAGGKGTGATFTLKFYK